MTEQCFDEFHRLFGIRYPFGDYHQAFVPEFNAGAMESPGCVTFRDPLRLPEPGDARTYHILRATTLAHEMAHQWFGDIVTPKWWDDLWLNESFAEYMGNRVTADVTEFGDAWVHNAYARRQWGLTADQRPSTHPVAGNGAVDAAAALQDFDGISYAKGASILKQLNSRARRRGVPRRGERPLRAAPLRQRHHARPLASWERAGAGDLSAFTDSWLRTAGPDAIVLDRAAGVLRRTPPAGHPADRAHTFRHRHRRPGRPGRVDRRPSSDAETDAVDGARRRPSCSTPTRTPGRSRCLDPVTRGDPARGCCPRPSDALLRAGVWNNVRSAFHNAAARPRGRARPARGAACPPRTPTTPSAMTPAWAIRTSCRVAADPAPRWPASTPCSLARAGASPAGFDACSSPPSRPASLAADAGLLRAWLEGRDLPDGVERRPRPALADAGPAGHARRHRPRRARRRPGRRAHRGLAGRARPGDGLAARRGGQGLGVAAVHRRGRRTQLRARGRRPRAVAGRPGAAHRAVRRPLLRRAARHRRRAQRLGAGRRAPRPSSRSRRWPTDTVARARALLDADDLDPTLRRDRRRPRPTTWPADGRPPGLRRADERPAAAARADGPDAGHASSAPRASAPREDRVATEEPLEIRLALARFAGRSGSG